MERRGGGRYHLRQMVPLLSGSGTSLKRGSTSKPNQGSKKKRGVSNSCDLRSWSDLPGELLDIISKRLCMVDYLSFGRVCMRWRSLFVASRKDFLESVPPLVVVMASRGKRTCFFSNISDGRRYKTKLPCFAGKFRIGMSSGYLITEGFHNTIWLTNPVTGHNLEVTKPFPFGSWLYRCDRTILAYTMPHQDLVILALSSKNYSLQFCRSKDAHWTIFQYADKVRAIMDIVVFKLKLYALTVDSHIGVVSLKSPSDLTLLELKDKPQLTNNVKFVASDEQLLVVDFVPDDRRLQVYWIDLLGKQWVKVNNLGDQALFLCDYKCSRLCNPTRWGGRSNCLYNLRFLTDKCELYSLDGNFIGDISIAKGETDASPRYTYGWYFPELSYNIDKVWDDQFGNHENFSGVV